MCMYIYIIILRKNLPIMPALCLMLDSPYYAQNYAGILCLSLGGIMDMKS